MALQSHRKTVQDAERGIAGPIILIAVVMLAVLVICILVTVGSAHTDELSMATTTVVTEAGSSPEIESPEQPIITINDTEARCTGPYANPVIKDGEQIVGIQMTGVSLTCVGPAPEDSLDGMLRLIITAAGGFIVGILACVIVRSSESRN